jgi:hypothetical protein
VKGRFLHIFRTPGAAYQSHRSQVIPCQWPTQPETFVVRITRSLRSVPLCLALVCALDLLAYQGLPVASRPASAAAFCADHGEVTIIAQHSDVVRNGVGTLTAGLNAGGEPIALSLSGVAGPSRFNSPTILSFTQLTQLTHLTELIGLIG